MGILITILIAALLYLLTFWVYGLYLHRLQEEVMFWKEECETDAECYELHIHELQNQLNQIPRSVREHYSKL